jgi:hypothetical protein
VSLIPSENDVVSHDINASEEIVRFDLSLAEVSRRDVQIASAADVSEIDFEVEIMESFSSRLKLNSMNPESDSG